jgi:hypothetical protein
MEEGTFEEFALKLLAALNDCGVEYIVVGGVAAVYYGRSRLTTDCDIVLSLEEMHLAGFAACMKKYGFRIREHDMLEGFKEKGHFNAYYGMTAFRADFSWRNGSLAEHGFERAKDARLFGILARMEAPEDVIIAKLVYGSPQDLDDAKAILLAQKKLDKEYLGKRAAEERVWDKLKQLYASIEK